MGIWDSKEDPRDLLIVQLQQQLDKAEEEVEFLRGQVLKLQEALVAKESPDAYAMLKADEAALREEEALTPEDREKREQEAEMTKAWVTNLEKPLFASADDMVTALAQNIGMPFGDEESIHGNEES